MRKLHPLRLLAGDGTSFLFLFRSADGDKEFSFTVNFLPDGNAGSEEAQAGV